MGARGPHDDLDAAKAVVGVAIKAMNQGDVVAGRALVDESLEHVTCDGVVHGPDRLFEEFRTQVDRWRIDYELEELVDAGDGVLITMLKVERPRVGGAVDRRKAVADLGVATPT